jgi:glycerol-1-phosphate dehydrogenase [NAD(P)+]
MIYKQLSYLPIIFQVDENIIDHIQEFLGRNKFIFAKVLVVSGKSHSRELAAQLLAGTHWESYVVQDNTFEEVDRLKSYAETRRYDLIVAIGGGKVLDTVKRVSYLSNINHLSVPTIISNDGLISPISVLKNYKGKTESIPGMMPMGVVIDLTIIMNSPINYIRAASGDILSNISATNDWILAYKMERDSINDIGFHLSRSAAHALLYFNDINLYSKPFLRMVIQGQINSGIAMSLAGTSRPCSGSEHLISHALTSMGLADHVLHGIQVASISLFTLFLQGKLQDIHLNYAMATEIPLDFTSFLANTEATELRKIYYLSREMRPGRYTVLDEIDADRFVQLLQKFKQHISQLALK